MKNIDDKFEEQFNRTYQCLYDHDDDDELQTIARVLISTFDELSKDNKQFAELVAEFVKKREDLISSDRECAAFMLVFSGYTLSD